MLAYRDNELKNMEWASAGLSKCEAHSNIKLRGPVQNKT